jgi:hypothetical protein
VEDVAAVTSDDITVAPFPGFNDPQTRSTDAGAGHDKDKWESGDVIYIQLNGTGSWYAMTYKEGTEGTDGTWSLPKTFPGMTREDSYKAVYAPNYEIKSDGSFGLKDGTNSLTTEYLTCEGTTKPITIAFGKRDYSRIRIYTGGKDVTIEGARNFVPADKKALPDGFTNGKKFSPDENGNINLYCSWGERAYLYFGDSFGISNSVYVYIGVPSSGSITEASVNNKSYLVDCSWVTLNLNNANMYAINVTDWSKYTDSGYTKVRLIGVWSDSYHSFSYNSKITSIDLSGVTGLDNSNLPYYFCFMCSSLSEIKFPNDIKYIPYDGFSECYNLKKIDIPSSVTSIDKRAFYNCKSLEKVVCNATTPPALGTYAFDNTPADKVLYVPDETAVKAYKADTNWSAAFGEDYIKKISEMPEDE